MKNGRQTELTWYSQVYQACICQANKYIVSSKEDVHFCLFSFISSFHFCLFGLFAQKGHFLRIWITFTYLKVYFSRVKYTFNI